MKTFLVIGGIIMLAMAGVIGYQVRQPEQPEQPLGSVQQASEYHALSIVPASSSEVLSTSAATLGSVIITGTGGAITVYNSTTTNANLRAIAATTSLPILAALPSSLGVGTYTFDVMAYDGLLVVLSGTPGTSTLTWR